MSAPRILVLFGNIPLLGHERGNVEVLDALVDTGCHALFVIRREWTKNTIQRELANRNLPYVTVPYLNSVRYGESLRTWIKNVAGILGGSLCLLWLMRKFRATHLHVGNVSDVLNFLPALAITRIPLVFRIGDVPPDHHFLWRMVWRFAIRRAKLFVCISRFLQSEVIAKGVSASRTLVIYSRPPGRPESNPSPERHSREGIIFAFVGQLIAEKGIELFIDAAIDFCHMHPSARFAIAGEVDPRNDVLRNVMERVRSKSFEDRILLHGYVDDIPRFLRHVDVLVCPSLCPEGLGNVVLEAKAAKLPSIVFPRGGLRELVTHGVDGYICGTSDVNGLISAFKTYADRPSLVDNQGRAALASLRTLGVHDFPAKWRAVYDQTR